ncbi:serine/threonine protein kinase [Nocardioides luteus]|uniref:non-specific serine/threonine protein kinase n=1 Tax=Nocardioides luteus TaxID=1844 RepID=A0ABQ5T0T9_9ACTN|nr:serine/threonine-protein kinase [Nocardioides luteus]MDR7311426.1 serine/threonine protein kinase [Nocardioides luteus]GGR55652.1 serine/threonine protein kinase [Nocardioides luteus]GLJ70078.1 serine/threonine protein kinase [Nocardioides luteus]
MIAGRYRLERELGRGAMGAVWLATDDILGRSVALKQLVALDGVSDAAVEREAQLAARLVHPNVVAVFDLVRDDDKPWLVMEYVEGKTLAHMVRDDGALTIDDAAKLIGQIASALRAAHAAGIVHRDVKPANIVVGRGGRAKLTDFGIARGVDSQTTQTGQVTGSPAYLAPEIATGGKASHASDIWSLGATLFQALTGEPPYGIGDNPLATLYRVVHEDPPRTPLAGRLSPLIEHTMAYAPADRWSAQDVLDFLAGRISEEKLAPVAPRTQSLAAVGAPAEPEMPAPVASKPVAARRRRWWPLMLLGAATVLVVAVGGALWANRGEEPSAKPEPAASASTLSKTDEAGEKKDEKPSEEPTPSESASESASESPSQSPSATQTAGATAEGIDAFVRNYLATAPANPDSAFNTMLTPAFQAKSGGIQGYRNWWGSVASTSVVSVSPSVDPLKVTYTYRYTMKDGRKDAGTTTLGLVYTDGRYLIDSEGGR